MSKAASPSEAPAALIRTGIELSDERCEPSTSSEQPDEGAPRQEEGPRQEENASIRTQLSQAQAANDLRVARLLFRCGFLGLPWLWFVVWFHYRRIAKLPHASPDLAGYVRYSAIGAAVGGTLFVAWFTTVQLNWRDWGAWGRSIMMVFPEGDEL